MTEPPESVEAYYKQGLVSTASVPRVVLMLYERLLMLLKQAMHEPEFVALRGHMAQIQQILSHMLELFLQAQDSSYRVLYLSHAEIAENLTDVLREREKAPELLMACYRQLESYYQAWQQELQIRLRFPNEQAARLNVRRHPNL